MKISLLRDYLVIFFSGRFDDRYYLKNYRDILLADANPLYHYVRSGWREGCNPTSVFDTNYYLAKYDDVKRLGVNPLVHYILFGVKEGRFINPDQEALAAPYRGPQGQRISFAESLRHKFRLLGKGIKLLINHGPAYTLRKIMDYRKRRLITDCLTLDSAVRGNLSDSDLEMQKKTHFEQNHKFSILVPLYNTSADFLQDLLESVVNQTYDGWELCLADGSESTQPHIQQVLSIYQKDPRIKYKRLERNLGIALNTQAAYEMARGDYVVLMDHDDILSADALYELAVSLQSHPEADILYSDRLIFSDETKRILAFHYLPGFSPDYLRSMNYMSHLIAYSQKILQQVGFERAGYEGSQDYELLLRCCEVTNRISHIPKVLYLCRASQSSVALNPENKQYAYEAGRKAIAEHINRIGFPGEVEFLNDLYAYRVHYQIGSPLVSIIIPNKDHVSELKTCLGSIFQRSSYSNFEILIVENNSQEQETFDYYDSLVKEPKVRILKAESTEFNFSYLNNFAVQSAKGDYVLLLNNDTEIISPNWIEEMLMFAQRPDVGAVGAKLLYPNNMIQHSGLVIGLSGDVVNAYGHKKDARELGYMHSLVLPQNCSAVTAACMMVSRADYLRVGGMDEDQFKIGLNDVDFCLKLRDVGLLNVWTPYAQLYHHESLSRGNDEHGKRRLRYLQEEAFFRSKWKKYYDDGDPFERKNFKGW